MYCFNDIEMEATVTAYRLKESLHAFTLSISRQTPIHSNTMSYSFYQAQQMSYFRRTQQFKI